MCSYYYDNEKECENRGIDYDLNACLEYNPQDSFSIEDIEKVLAVHEGENDEEDWHWIIELKNKKFIYLRGGCDYTGWDCQSWASSEIKDTIEDALKVLYNENLPVNPKNHPINAGLGHMINYMSGTYLDKDKEIYKELKNQIKSYKNKTWRESIKNDMPKDLPKLDH